IADQSQFVHGRLLGGRARSSTGFKSTGSPGNMTHCCRDANRARALQNRCPSKNRGRRECRVHAAPTALRANKKDARRPTQVRRNHSDTPCAMALRLLRALPGVPGFLAPVVLSISAFRPQGRNRVSRRLDPSVGGSGPHGLTVRIAPHLLRPNASIAARLTSGDEWPSRPSCRGGMASLNHNFVLSERQIFLRCVLDSSGKTGGVFSLGRVVRATL